MQCFIVDKALIPTDIFLPKKRNPFCYKSYLSKILAENLADSSLQKLGIRMFIPRADKEYVSGLPLVHFKNTSAQTPPYLPNVNFLVLFKSSAIFLNFIIQSALLVKIYWFRIF